MSALNFVVLLSNDKYIYIYNTRNSIAANELELKKKIAYSTWYCPVKLSTEDSLR